MRGERLNAVDINLKIVRNDPIKSILDTISLRDGSFDICWEVERQNPLFQGFDP